MGKTYGDDYNKNFDNFAAVTTALTLTSTAVGGLSKIISKGNQQKAQKIYDVAYNRYISSFNQFQHNVVITKKTIANVVSIKKQIMLKNMKKFLKAYKRLAPQFKLQNSQGLEELQRFIFRQEDFQEIKRTANAYRSYNEYKLGEKVSEVAMLMVQDGTVSNLANCIKDVIFIGKTDDYTLKKNNIDNLKIQSINILAQYSTVSLEFAISNISDAFRSGKYLKEMKEAAAQLDVQKEILDTNNVKINAINSYANVHLKLLTRLSPLIDEYVNLSVKIIKSKDNIFHFGKIKEDQFTQNEFEILAFTFSLVAAVKAVIDSPIISKNGNVFNGSNSKFNEVQNHIEMFERKCIEMKSPNS